MKLPRKLKKGCRTLNGNPRTKWQRKGRLHFAKVLEATNKRISLQYNPDVVYVSGKDIVKAMDAYLRKR